MQREHSWLKSVYAVYGEGRFGVENLKVSRVFRKGPLCLLSAYQSQFDEKLGGTAKKETFRPKGMKSFFYL